MQIKKKLHGFDDEDMESTKENKDITEYRKIARFLFLNTFLFLMLSFDNNNMIVTVIIIAHGILIEHLNK